MIFLEGDLEISIFYDLYNSNIAAYKEEREINNNQVNLGFLNYINNDNNENKDLYAITDMSLISNIHYNRVFANNN